MEWQQATRYIYMAIRRPNKPAEEFEPEELFGLLNNIPASSAVNNTFIETDNEFDMVLSNPDYVGGGSTYVSSKLQGGKGPKTNDTAGESSIVWFQLDYQNGFVQALTNGTELLAYTMKRAPGFFDVVTYEGDGVNGREVPHNLAAAPEMMWFKQTNNGGAWKVYSKSLPITDQLVLNSSDAPQAFDIFGGVPPTSEVVTLSSSDPNANTAKYIAYLWASVPGICDIGSYTGNGNYQDIDCGFTNGARFVLLKRSDGFGDWMYFDTLRGIASDSSPMLKLNETDGQDTASFIRPFSGGFQVTANPTGINGAEYIYMAIA